MRKDEIKSIIKETLKEILIEERINIYELIIPKISKREMKEIEKKYGPKPQYNEKEFTNMTEWVFK
jgi:hypothetical protein